MPDMEPEEGTEKSSRDILGVIIVLAVLFVIGVWAVRTMIARL
jgi:hypothetical protein